MIAEINKEGVLIITPKNETEIYALVKWHEEQKKLSKEVKLFIKTDLK